MSNEKIQQKQQEKYIFYINFDRFLSPTHEPTTADSKEEEDFIELKHVLLWKDVLEFLNQRRCKFILLSERLSSLRKPTISDRISRLATPTSKKHASPETMFSALDGVFGPEREFLTKADAIELLEKATLKDSNKPIQGALLEAGLSLFPKPEHILFAGPGDKTFSNGMYWKGEYRRCRNIPWKKELQDLPYPLVEMLLTVFEMKTVAKIVSTMPEEHRDILEPTLDKSYPHWRRFQKPTKTNRSPTTSAPLTTRIKYSPTSPTTPESLTTKIKHSPTSPTTPESLAITIPDNLKPHRITFDQSPAPEHKRENKSEIPTKTELTEYYLDSNDRLPEVTNLETFIAHAIVFLTAIKEKALSEDISHVKKIIRSFDSTYATFCPEFKITHNNSKPTSLKRLFELLSTSNNSEEFYSFLTNIYNALLKGAVEQTTIENIKKMLLDQPSSQEKTRKTLLLDKAYNDIVQTEKNSPPKPTTENRTVEDVKETKAQKLAAPKSKTETQNIEGVFHLAADSFSTPNNDSLWKSVLTILDKKHFKVVSTDQSLLEKNKNEPISSALSDEKSTQITLLDASRKLFPESKRHIFVSSDIIPAEKTKSEFIPVKREEFLADTNPYRTPLHAIDMLIKAFGGDIEKVIDAILRIPEQENVGTLLLLLIKRLDSSIELTAIEYPAEDATKKQKNIANILASYRKIYNASTDKTLPPKIGSSGSAEPITPPPDEKTLFQKIKTLETREALQEALQEALKKYSVEEESQSATYFTPKKNLTSFYLEFRIEHAFFKNSETFYTYTTQFLLDLQKYYQENKSKKHFEENLKNIICHFYSAHFERCNETQLNFFGQPFQLSVLLGLLYRSEESKKFNFLLEKICNAVQLEIEPAKIETVQIWQTSDLYSKSKTASLITKQELKQSEQLTRSDIVSTKTDQKTEQSSPQKPAPSTPSKRTSFSLFTPKQSPEKIAPTTIEQKSSKKKMFVCDLKDLPIIILDEGTPINIQASSSSSSAQKDRKDTQEQFAKIGKKGNTIRYSAPSSSRTTENVNIKIEDVSILRSIFNTLVKHGHKVTFIDNDLLNLKDPDSVKLTPLAAKLGLLNQVFGINRKFFTEQDAITLANKASENDNETLVEASQGLPNFKDFEHVLVSHDAPVADAPFKHLEPQNSSNPNKSLNYAIQMLIEALGKEEAIREILRMREHSDILLPLVESLGHSLDVAKTPDETNTLNLYKDICKAAKSDFKYTQLGMINVEESKQSPSKASISEDDLLYEGESLPFNKKILEAKNAESLKEILVEEQEKLDIKKTESLRALLDIEDPNSENAELLQNLLDEGQKKSDSIETDPSLKEKINLTHFYLNPKSGLLFPDPEMFKIYSAIFLSDLQKYYTEELQIESLKRLKTENPKEIKTTITPDNAKLKKEQKRHSATIEQIKKAIHIELKQILSHFYVAHYINSKNYELTFFGQKFNLSMLLNFLHESPSLQEFNSLLQNIHGAVRPESMQTMLVKEAPVWSPKPQVALETPKKEKDSKKPSSSSAPVSIKTKPTTSSSLPKPIETPVVVSKVKETKTSEPAPSKPTPMPAVLDKKETKVPEKKKVEDVGVIYFNLDKSLDSYAQGADAQNDFDIIYEPFDDKRPTEERRLNHGNIQKIGEDTVIYAGFASPNPLPEGVKSRQKFDHKGKPIFQSLPRGKKDPVIIPKSKLDARFDHTLLWGDVLGILNKHGFKVVPLFNNLLELYDVNYPAYAETMLTPLNAVFGKKRTFLTEKDGIDIIIQAAQPDNSGKKPIDSVRTKESKDEKITQFPLLNAGKQLFSNVPRHILVSHNVSDIASAKSSGYETVQVDPNTLTDRIDPIRHPYHAIDMLIIALGPKKAVDIILSMAQHADVLIPLLLNRLKDPELKKALDTPEGAKETPAETRTRERRDNILNSHRIFYEKFDAKDDKSQPPKKEITLRAFFSRRPGIIAEVEKAKTHAGLKERLRAEESLVSFYTQPKTSKTVSLNNKPTHFENLDIFNTYTAEFLNHLRTYSATRFEEECSKRIKTTHRKSLINDKTVENKQEASNIESELSTKQEIIKDIHNELKEIISNFYSAHNDYGNQPLVFAGKTFTLKYFLHRLYISENCDEFNQILGKIYGAVRSKISEIQKVEIWQRPADLSFTQAPLEIKDGKSVTQKAATQSTKPSTQNKDVEVQQLLTTALGITIQDSKTVSETESQEPIKPDLTVAIPATNGSPKQVSIEHEEFLNSNGEDLGSLAFHALYAHADKEPELTAEERAKLAKLELAKLQSMEKALQEEREMTKEETEWFNATKEELVRQSTVTSDDTSTSKEAKSTLKPNKLPGDEFALFKQEIITLPEPTGTGSTAKDLPTTDEQSVPGLSAQQLTKLAESATLAATKAREAEEARKLLEENEKETTLLNVVKDKEETPAITSDKFEAKSTASTDEQDLPIGDFIPLEDNDSSSIVRNLAVELAKEELSGATPVKPSAEETSLRAQAKPMPEKKDEPTSPIETDEADLLENEYAGGFARQYSSLSGQTPQSLASANGAHETEEETQPFGFARQYSSLSGLTPQSLASANGVHETEEETQTAADSKETVLPKSQSRSGLTDAGVAGLNNAGLLGKYNSTAQLPAAEPVVAQPEKQAEGVVNAALS